MKLLKQILILIFVYCLVALPFKVMQVIPGFTDIRPVSLLEPVYAVFFGPLGCIAMAIGNLIMDLIGGALKWSSIAGFAASFLGPYLIYLFQVRWSKTPFSLKRIPQLLKYVGVICLAAVLETVVISIPTGLLYPDVEVEVLAMTVFLNTTLFPIVFGIPIIILLQEEFGFHPVRRSAPKKS